jgi:hypothetical protein
MKFKADLSDLDRVLADLQTLSRGMQGSALRSALRAGASVLTRAEKAASPSRRVRKSLTAIVKGSGGHAEARIGAKKRTPGGRLLHLIEGGAKPHRISPRRGKVLKVGARFVRGVINHPGARARPFFRKELPAQRAEIERKTASALGQIVAKMKLKAFKKQGK